MRRLIALAALFLAVRCAHWPANPPLAKPADISYGYRYSNVVRPSDDDLFVVLTFSGGGSRAAGFAYGVLRELEQTRLPDGTALIDRIDVISSVSGGSFMSMYFGLHGKAGLDSFRTRFLERNVEGALFRAAFLNPVNIVRLMSRNFSRIDVAAEVYDRLLFDGRTYEDLLAAQRAERRPLIIANATELDLGARFEWTQDQFDPLCSDLSPVHVARAVAASSAFPVLLTPMVLNNYQRGDNPCQYRKPVWVDLARGDLEVNPARHRLAVEMEAYLNPHRQWLHLMDGGIADNIGLRGTLHAMISTDTFVQPAGGRTGYTIAGDLERRQIRRLLIIVVNAATSNNLKFDAKETNPWLPGILSAISNTPLANYSFDTVNMLLQESNAIMLRQAEPGQCVDAVKAQCPEVNLPGANNPAVAIYPVILGFSAIADDQLRRDVNAIGTNFALKPGQLDLLQRAAKSLLDGSNAFQQFLSGKPVY